MFNPNPEQQAALIAAAIEYMGKPVERAWVGEQLTPAQRALHAALDALLVEVAQEYVRTNPQIRAEMERLAAAATADALKRSERFREAIAEAIVEQWENPPREY